MSDFDSLAVDLLKAGPAATAMASAAVRKTALDMEATAKTFAPVDTGNLRDGISSGPIGGSRSLQPGDLDAEIGPTAEYGEYVERGTARNAPQAYMGPAFDRHAHQLVKAAEQIGAEIL